MKQSRANRIIALAYFHRYGWIAVMMICICFYPEYAVYLMSGFCMGFSVWSLVGYKLRWKHIFCSYQESSHQSMTPHSVRWGQIRKSDAYGIPLIFAVLSLMLLYAAIKG